jgi:hypothetical protein
VTILNLAIDYKEGGDVLAVKDSGVEQGSPILGDYCWTAKGSFSQRFGGRI